jgi:hypothetical protein
MRAAVSALRCSSPVKRLLTCAMGVSLASSPRMSAFRRLQKLFSTAEIGAQSCRPPEMEICAQSKPAYSHAVAADRRTHHSKILSEQEHLHYVLLVTLPPRSNPD